VGQRPAHLAVDHHRARQGHHRGPAGQVDHRAVEVALALEHRSVGQPDPHVRQLVGGPRALDQRQRDLGRVLGRGDGEHHLVADGLHHPTPVGGDHVERQGLELVDDAGQLDVVDLLTERREAHQVGEAHGQAGLLARGGLEDAPPRGVLQVPAPGRLEHPGHHRQQLARLKHHPLVAALVGPTAPGRGPADHVDLGRGDAGDRRADDPAHLQHERRGLLVGRHQLAHLGQDLDVGLGEDLLAGVGGGVAQRAPQLAHQLVGQAGAGGHLGQVEAGRLGHDQLLDPQQGQRAVGLGLGDLALVDAHVAQQGPQRGQRRLAFVG
jgi:hypothetical protein